MLFRSAPDQVTVANRSPRVAPTVVGAIGPAAGTAGSEGADDVDVPITLVAVTVKVYVVPLVRPITTQVVAGAVATQLCPDDAVAVYVVIAAPLPSAVNNGDDVQDTCTELSPRTAVTAVGATGTPAGITALLANEGTEEPVRFCAVTANVYEIAFVNPVTVHVSGLRSTPITVTQVAPPGEIGRAHV